MHTARLPLLCVAALVSSCVASTEPATVSGDGATLTVPAGAIDDPSILAISSTTTPPVALQAGLSLVSDVYEFTPHGQTFSAAVTIELPFDTSIPSADYGDLGVFRYDDIDTADGVWQQMTGASFAGGVATFETSAFSWYAVAEIATLAVRPGSFTPNSDADMEAFCADYVAVEDDLTIGPDVVNTNALSCLEEVGGVLTVAAADALTSLNLPVLRTVGGRLNIQGASALETVSLGSLASIGPVWITNVPALSQVSMGALETFGYWTTADMGLETLEGVRFPATIVDTVQLEGSALMTLGGAFAGTTTAERILLGDSPLVLGSELASVQTADLLSFYNNEISSVAGLTSLTSVGWLALLELNLLTSTTLPSNVQSMQSFEVADCSAIIALGALGSVTELPGTLRISGNGALSDISALEVLTEIGILEITDNPSLSQAAIDAFIAAVGEENIGKQTITNNGS